MLSSLSVKNLALADDVSIDFQPGLNVVTGETGAGKSMLIGALKLIAGERGDRGVIRTGEDLCTVEAVFALSDPSLVNLCLEDAGVDLCDEGQLIIRRQIKVTGGGQNRVNGCTVTQNTLRNLGELLVDMHGPYDHQSLLKTDTQLDILDGFGGVETEMAAYLKVWHERRALLEQKAELEAEGSVSDQIDMLSFRVREIEEAELIIDEEDEVLEEHSLQANAVSILELGHIAVNHLQDGANSAFDNLVEVQNALNELASMLPEAKEWYQEAKSAALVVQELTNTLQSRISGLESDPARLTWLDARVATYKRMKDKYGPEVSDVLATLDAAQERLEAFQARDEILAGIDSKIEAIDVKLHKVGEKLRKKRQPAASKLASEIIAHLRQLGFEHADFQVLLEPAEPRASGIDAIEFGFAPNVGETLKPLRSIASSGEISRVMLACKAVLAKHDKVPLLVFDEIDANVGGEMGTAIGEKMGEVAAHHQIITITHLPQVAVQGQRHLHVQKQVEGKRTFTRVAELEGDARVEEVARMLGGKNHTAVTMDHARELLRTASKGKAAGKGKAASKSKAAKASKATARK